MIPENEFFAPNDLILEKARYNLGLRLFKLGKIKFALKEFKALKCRLEAIMGGVSEVPPAKEAIKTTAKLMARKPAGKENAPQAGPGQKESISSILEYGSISTTHPALSMAIDCQIGILRCIVALNRPDIVEVGGYSSVSGFESDSVPGHSPIVQ